MRNIIYWLGSRGLWRDAYPNCNAPAYEHTSADEYNNANRDTERNAYHHSHANSTPVRKGCMAFLERKGRKCLSRRIEGISICGFKE